MAYTPNNNPYIPGDPYSYDLKWIVARIKELFSSVSSLSARIGKLTGGAYNFETAQDLIDSDAEADSLAYIAGYYAAGDGGANWYYITADPAAIVGLDFYLTLAGGKYAIPVIVTPYVTPEMFGATGDGSTDDSAAFTIALKYPWVLLGAKTYHLDSSVQIASTCRRVTGISEGVSHISCSAGCFTLDGTISALEIAFLRIQGSDTDSAVAGRIYNARIHDLRITHFDKGLDIQSTSWTGFNRFQNVFIDYCGTGIYVRVAGFNDNSFNDCVIQHCTTGFDSSSVQTLNFINCDFEQNTKALNMGEADAALWDGCYAEANGIFMGFRANAGYYGSSYRITNCRFYQPDADSQDGWLVTLGTRSSSNTARTVIEIDHCHFDNWVPNHHKPFAFDDNNTECYAYINMHYNTFQAVTGALITYMGLFDTTNYSSYAYNSKYFAIDTDLIFDRFDKVNFYRHGIGNTAANAEGNTIFKAIGKYEITSTGNTALNLAVGRLVVPYSTVWTTIPVQYTDNTVELCRTVIQNNLIQIYVDSAKTTAAVLFDTEYQVQYS